MPPQTSVSTADLLPALDKGPAGLAHTHDQSAEHTLLDVMRGLMAIVVFGAHTGQILLWRLLGVDSPITLWSGIAARHAVLVFFVLSGHLITKSVVDNIRKHGTFRISEYVAARTARIYPPLLGAIFISFLVWSAIEFFNRPGGLHPYGLAADLYRARDHFTFPPWDVLHVLTMQGGLGDADGPLWTLFIEVQIYVCVLGVAAFWQKNLLSKIACALIALAALNMLRENLFFAGIWLIGASTYAISIRRNAAKYLAWFFFFAAGAALALMQYLHLPVNGRVDFLSQASASLFYAVSMFYCYPRVKWPRRVVATADFSYSLYVMHWPLLMMALSLTQSWTGYSTIRAIVICIGACICIPIIVASIASVLERPHQFKKWLLRYVDHHRAGRLVCAIIAIGIGGVYFYPIILRHL